MIEDRPWMIALEEQFLALTNVRSDLRTYLANEAQFTDPLARRADWEALARRLVRDLPHLETFAWSADVIQAVAQAAKSLPKEAALDATTLPAPRGWWWLNGHVPDMPAAKALAWGQTARGAVFNVFESFPEKSRRGTWPGNTNEWFFHQPLSDIRPEDQDDLPPSVDFQRDLAPLLDLLRFFLAGCIWLRQRILLTADGHVERHLRRRLEHEHQEEIASTVKVVELRRASYDHHDAADTHHDVDWSCRWVVTGHWRLQPYKDGQKAIYILPYVKGPADKPLRLPTRTVYEVDR